MKDILLAPYFVVADAATDGAATPCSDSLPPNSGQKATPRWQKSPYTRSGPLAGTIRRTGAVGPCTTPGIAVHVSPPSKDRNNCPRWLTIISDRSGWIVISLTVSGAIPLRSCNHPLHPTLERKRPCVVAIKNRPPASASIA